MSSNILALACISFMAIILSALYDQVTMALAFYNNHIIYYHTDVKVSIVLSQTYFTNPNYSVAWCWVYAILLSPNTIIQTETHTYHYTKFFNCTVGYTHLGFSSTHLMAVIDFSNVVLPYVITAYLAL